MVWWHTAATAWRDCIAGLHWAAGDVATWRPNSGSSATGGCSCTVQSLDSRGSPHAASNWWLGVCLGIAATTDDADLPLLACFHIALHHTREVAEVLLTPCMESCRLLAIHEGDLQDLVLAAVEVLPLAIQLKLKLRHG
eukprot:CAMPEP_0115367824 /NCGR_PEP_ID=MMETSP0270-20121206/105508_1 /TAXON_ID=71861 /ORGANISM="Scrippsiella trochoidea, Strain CCMP3099" /LENGTH=138 /DNA_ID=CAMNT_0002790615 /DNA_START=91 /DNA_END=503 /DNA_ORIENTATION=+